MTVRNHTGFVTLAALVAAACCSCAERDRGRVQSEWASTFRELGIVPTFPPREDFLVGDLYVTHYDPNSPVIDEIFRKHWDNLNEDEKAIRNQIGMNVRLMSLDVNSDLDTEYRNRLSAPSSGFSPDRLLDVPAIALANVGKETADAAVKAKEEAIKVETTKLKTAQDALTRATNTLATAKTAQTRADADLADAIKTAGDLTTLRKTEDEARKADDAAKKAVTDKQTEVDNATPATKLALEAELKRLKADQTVTAAQLSAATTNVKAANDALVNVDKPDGFRAVAATKKDDERKAEDALETAKTDAAKVTADEQPKIDALNAELKDLKDKAAAAKTQFDALVAAAKLLSLGQPMYANRDVYSGAMIGPLSPLFHNPDNVTRLRLVAFPDFVTATFTGVDAAAMIPVEAVNLGVSFSSQDVSSVSVKVPAAESYALPWNVLAPMVYDGPIKHRNLKIRIAKALMNYADPATGTAPSATVTVKSSRDVPGRVSTAEASVPVAIEPKLPDQGSKPDTLYVTVVSEVFYARALDVSVSYKSTRGGRLTGSPTGTTQPAGAPIGSTDSLAAMISGIQSRIGQTQVVPGGSIQIVSGNEFGIGLRRTFDRPVAIGYRGFVIPVETIALTEADPDKPVVAAGAPKIALGPVPPSDKDLKVLSKPHDASPE